MHSIRKWFKVIIIIIGVIALMCFFISACATRTVWKAESEKRFLAYEESVKSVANEYGLTIKHLNYFDSEIEGDAPFDDEPDCMYNRLRIDISENSSIDILVTNDAPLGTLRRGAERFVVTYEIEPSDAEDYNSELFVELVNCISGRKISHEYCKEFLDAPESKYSSKRYNFLKLHGEIIAKQDWLNFVGNWIIFYVLDSEGVSRLEFGGLTKAGTHWYARK